MQLWVAHKYRAGLVPSGMLPTSSLLFLDHTAWSVSRRGSKMLMPGILFSHSHWFALVPIPADLVRLVDSVTSFLFLITGQQ